MTYDLILIRLALQFLKILRSTLTRMVMYTLYGRIVVMGVAIGVAIFTSTIP